jgi:hypothetical protein
MRHVTRLLTILGVTLGLVAASLTLDTATAVTAPTTTWQPRPEQ